MLLTHCARLAASRAAWTAGKSSAISTAMIAMTTSNSIKVNPRRIVVGSCNKFGGPRASEQHLEELVGHHLEVVGPFEDDDVLLQVHLVHAPERAEEVPQPRPDPLERVAMH